MNILENARIALKTLVNNKLRSGLTMLGILIGNGSIILMVGIVQGAQNYTLKQIESYGVNLLSIFPGGGEVGSWSAEETWRLVLADADAIRSYAPAVDRVAPQISSFQLATYRDRSTQPNITGTTPDFLFVRNFRVASGRFFDETEQQQNAAVIVLGSIPARQLFGHEHPLGRDVQINNISFRVIGVLESKGSLNGINQDNTALVPITTLAAQVDGRSSPYGIPLDSIELSANDPQSVKAAEFQVTNLLTRRHGKKDFTIETNKSFQDLVNQVGSVLSLMLGAIASISLVVGGIGIMNIMLVSVTERTQEIGVRKAVGATQHVILMQFLIESIVLSVAGGLAGVALGVGGVALVSLVTPLTPTVSIVAIVVAIGVSGSIGLIFGVVPAQRAARLDPIVALRSA
ncbi:ABC transporter permease [Thermocoleostomius sinensis]|uniref:ABC transporter permease n=1 Tax=Thermocoleostomius sinensis A174 TaxID=2016057 RepID=A0A9E8ZEJ6_9CYAN|nr:ABC transporter permease [Thermocoleostomius sinensis]WAL61371.1 ABC transporter permease [Thermocoleostomius sinensis A174]